MELISIYLIILKSQISMKFNFKYKNKIDNIFFKYYLKIIYSMKLIIKYIYRISIYIFLWNLIFIIKFDSQISILNIIQNSKLKWSLKKNNSMRQH